MDSKMIIAMLAVMFNKRAEDPSQLFKEQRQKRSSTYFWDRQLTPHPPKGDNYLLSPYTVIDLSWWITQLSTRWWEVVLR